MEKIIYVLGLLILNLLIVIIGPMLTIWSINTIFLLNIPLNFWSWFAVFWIHGIISGSTSRLVQKIGSVKNV